MQQNDLRFHQLALEYSGQENVTTYTKPRSRAIIVSGRWTVIRRSLSTIRINSLAFHLRFAILHSVFFNHNTRSIIKITHFSNSGDQLLVVCLVRDICKRMTRINTMFYTGGDACIRCKHPDKRGDNLCCNLQCNFGYKTMLSIM